MRLKKARVTKYRSIRDSSWFDVEDRKTILVGPNPGPKIGRSNAPTLGEDTLRFQQLHSVRSAFNVFNNLGNLLSLKAKP